MSAKDRDNSKDASPTLAVVICTRDRPASLLDTLRSLRTQTRRPDELLIMDDGCLSDADCQAIEMAAAAAASDWRIIPTGGRGLTASRNLAAQSTKGDILLFLDDDVTCEPGVVCEVVRLMTDPLVAGVTATIIEPAFRTRSARLFQAAYRLAGWWSIAPHGTAAGAKPSVLNEPSSARRAKWLSGAAMALRRSVVLANPFDESLTEYALGEDRELGYRLAPNHWLLESKRARVIHRRDGGGRANPYRMGFMTARNYTYILRKTCDLSAIDIVLIAWSFCVLSIMYGGCALMGRSSHWHELRGLVAGIWSIVRERHSGAKDQSRRVLTPVCGEKPGDLRVLSPNRAEDSPALIGGMPTLVNRSRLRALFVTNRLTHGGAERMLLTLVNRLPALNIVPTIACLKDAGPLAGECAKSNIVVHEDILRHKTDVAVILRLRQIIEAADIDIVVVAHSGGDRMFWPTIAAAASDLPVVVWSHWFPRPGIAHIERPNRALYRLIDAFVALGDAHRAALIRHEHVPAGRVSVIQNAIELERFDQAVPRAALRSAIGLKLNEIGVGIIANLRPEKRHDVFLKAAAQLMPAHANLRFFIIGEGPGRLGVEGFIRDCGLDSSIVRLLGARDDTPELLRALDIACLCSDIECMPVVMLEAAAAGCAFIGPNVGGIPEFLTHRDTGLLVEPSDAAGLADAISELSTDAALRQRLTTAASRRVREGFNAECMAESFAQLFRRCVKLRRQGRRLRGMGREAGERPIASKST